MTSIQSHAIPTEPSSSHAHAHHAHHLQHEPEVDGQNKSWLVLVVALIAQILVVLDISVVNTALPSIGDALNLRSADLQWVVTAYLMMSGGGLLLGGRIADLLSRRRVFLTGLTLFTSASLVSGTASNAGELIAARAGQGMAAALLTPAALSLIMTTYTGSQRRKGLALWGAVGSMGIAAGVLVGGALTTWAGWQAIFWINVPIGVVALIIAFKVVPQADSAHAGLKQFDLPGAITVLGGLMSLMYALGGTGTSGWLSARTSGGFGVAAVLLAAFAIIEGRTEQGTDPTAHLEGQPARVRHRGDARNHGHSRRRRPSHFDLPSGRARVHRIAGGAGFLAVRVGHYSWRPSRAPPPQPRSTSEHRHRRLGTHRRCFDAAGDRAD